MGTSGLVIPTVTLFNDAANAANAAAYLHETETSFQRWDDIRLAYPKETPGEIEGPFIRL